MYTSLNAYFSNIKNKILYIFSGIVAVIYCVKMVCFDTFMLERTPLTGAPVSIKIERIRNETARGMSRSKLHLFNHSGWAAWKKNQQIKKNKKWRVWEIEVSTLPSCQHLFKTILFYLNLHVCDALIYSLRMRMLPGHVIDQSSICHACWLQAKERGPMWTGVPLQTRYVTPGRARPGYTQHKGVDTQKPMATRSTPLAPLPHVSPPPGGSGARCRNIYPNVLTMLALEIGGKNSRKIECLFSVGGGWPVLFGSSFPVQDRLMSYNGGLKFLRS